MYSVRRCPLNSYAPGQKQFVSLFLCHRGTRKKAAVAWNSITLVCFLCIIKFSSPQDVFIFSFCVFKYSLRSPRFRSYGPFLFSPTHSTPRWIIRGQSFHQRKQRCRLKCERTPSRCGGGNQLPSSGLILHAAEKRTIRERTF